MMKFDRPTLVTLTAPTCSGKSYLLNELTARGIFSRIVSTTTRQPRQGETHGFDYYFISDIDSREMEREGLFFELIEFNGVRYGVTNEEMEKKMQSGSAPIVILEPKGLQIYEQKCLENNWDIFKVYVHTVESERIERLLRRTIISIWDDIDHSLGKPGAVSRYQDAFHAVAAEEIKSGIPGHIKQLQSRLMSILGDERRWQNVTTWDAIVPGDDVEKAISMIEQGIKWRNRKRAEPQAIGAVKLPL